MIEVISTGSEKSSMRIVGFRAGNRASITAALLGVLAMVSGCGGDIGESNVAGTTPPPGKSSQEIADAMKKAYGTTGIPKPTKGAPKVPAP
jgi:hypothetical protein